MLRQMASSGDQPVDDVCQNVLDLGVGDPSHVGHISRHIRLFLRSITCLMDMLEVAVACPMTRWRSCAETSSPSRFLGCSDRICLDGRNRNF